MDAVCHTGRQRQQARRVVRFEPFRFFGRADAGRWFFAFEAVHPDLGERADGGIGHFSGQSETRKCILVRTARR